MKRCCKKVSITNLGLITAAVIECLNPSKKRKRRDTIYMFRGYLAGVSKGRVIRHLRSKDEVFYDVCHRIAKDLQTDIMNGNLQLTIPKIRERVDAGSGKTRKITILNIRHLLLDHVAVKGMDELVRRIGITQVSSIKGRGAHYGKKFIEKWLRGNKPPKYAVKLDIKDFYGSIDKAVSHNWFTRRIKNPGLLWLIDSLVGVIEKGIPIGSFLSQTIANLYLSDVWHYAKEHLTYSRKSSSRYRADKTVHAVKHCLFYMDDMLFLGTNKRRLKSACKAIVAFIENTLRLKVKSDWQIHKISVNHPIDIMGFRFSHNLTTLRKRVFRLARRSILRAKRKVRSLKFCARLMSYKGYMDYTASKTVLYKLNAVKFFQKASNLISAYAPAC